MDESYAPNPYVGPRSFREEDAPVFFGRDREVADLLRMVISERIVLLYSPSGAGKTSLLRAGLVPALEKEGFHVHPIIRVNREVPAGDGESRGNRFVESMLLSLGAEVDARHTAESAPSDAVPERLVAHLDTLRARARDAEAGAPRYDVLIFDQFEEILTTDPASRAARQERIAFFEDVAGALRDPNLWAVFSIREDYLAGLDPYRRPIPTRLSNHFRLDLLQLAGARKAISEPPRVSAHVTIDDDAVAHIVDNLSRTALSAGPAGADLAGDGAGDGIYVEPLHLQVVCDRLWDTLRPQPGTQVSVDQIGDLAEVDTALRDYYEVEVGRIASETPYADERDIREWFDERLIVSELGIRGQVPREQGMSGELDNRVIEMLVQSKLVNKETRLKNTWYELSHDRLIPPIRQSNGEWVRTHLNTFQKKARDWDRTGRSTKDLLGPRAWLGARRWAKRQGPALRAHEQQFLEQSRDALTRRYLPAIVGFPLLLALGVLWLVLDDDHLLQDTNRWANQALVWMPLEGENRPDLALLLSAEAVDEQYEHHEPISFDARRSLYNGLAGQAGAPVALPYSPPVGPRALAPPLALSGDGRIVATVDVDSNVVLLDLPVVSFGAPDDDAGTPFTFTPENGTATSLLFVTARDNPDVPLLVVGTSQGAVEVWKLEDGVDPSHVETLGLQDNVPACVASGPTRGNPCGIVKSLAISPDDMLAAGYSNGEVRVWQRLGDEGQREYEYLSTLAAPETPHGEVGPARSTQVVRVLLDQSGSLIVLYTSGMLGVSLHPWEETAVEPFGTLQAGSAVDTLAVSQDGRFLAVGGDDGIFLMSSYSNVDGEPGSATLAASEPVSGLVFSPADSATLYSSYSNGQVVRWTVDSSSSPRLEPATIVSGVPGQGIDDLTISTDARWLVTRSDDRRLWAWSTGGFPLLAQAVTSPLTCIQELTISGGRVRADDLMEWELGTMKPIPLPGGATPFASEPTASIGDRVGGVSSIVTPTPAARSGVIPIASPATPSSGSTSTGSTTRPFSRLSQCQSPQALGGPEIRSLQFADGTPSSSILRAVEWRSLGGDSKDLLLTAHQDLSVSLWERSNNAWARLDTFENSRIIDFTSLTRNAEGTMIAAGTEEGVVVVWGKEADSWKQLVQTHAHSGQVTSMGFSQDEDYLATGDENGRVIVWNLEPLELVPLACDLAGRPLSKQEIEDYLERDPDDYKPRCELPEGTPGSVAE